MKAPAVERWPALHYDEWKDTKQTLHMWLQMAGKIRLRQERLVNHWWNVALYVTPHGLTTSMMPYGNGRFFELVFDFVRHELRIAGCDGELATIPLEPMTVAAFYERLMGALDSLDLHVKINPKPVEVPDPIPFDRDTVHASYDRAATERFWRVLLQADRLCKEFRSEFIGKASPVHFFWGGMDLASTRFSGRKAPPHPGGIPNTPDSVTREGYSHEEHSVGFWPGMDGVDAMFYAYMYPSPDGYANAPVEPEGASWSTTFGEFVLPYEAVRTARDPDDAVLSFFRSTYESGATLADWDRASLERATPAGSSNRRR